MELHKTTDIFEGGHHGESLEELLNIAHRIFHLNNLSTITNIYKDLTEIYSGIFPGFRLSAPKYHNLRHARLTALATVRLFHGLRCEGRDFSHETFVQGLLSAFFHDSGMLLSDSDTALTGSEYFRYHEERSITFVQRYISRTALPSIYAGNCAYIIRCTDFDLDPRSLTPPSEEIKLAGQVVGSADILAQMADRYYLESLPLLFQEQKEGAAHTYATPLELMQRTTHFFHTTIEERLQTIFSDVSRAMSSHFRERWGIEKDLYAENMQKNVRYLETIIERCKSEQRCIEGYLRRTPPACSS